MENRTNYSDPCLEQPLQPNCPAVWKGHYPYFYGMHIAGICQIALSVIGSIAVIFKIAMKRSARSAGSLSDRFPLYIAIADLLWGMAHITDHIVLLSTHYYPDKWVVLLLSNTNYFLIGYQQLMYGGVALYTYLKIVKKVQLGLGRWDWKLHGICAGTVLSLTIVADIFGLLGVSRYWIVEAEGHPHWALSYYFLATFVMIQSVCTIIAYTLIKRDVARHKKDLIAVTKDATLSTTASSNFHDTAEQCLTTFVFVGICLYLPFGIVDWIVLIQDLAGYDIFALNWYNMANLFAVLVLCNAGGFVNAVAYFRNERIKALALAAKNKEKDERMQSKLARSQKLSTANPAKNSGNSEAEGKV